MCFSSFGYVILWLLTVCLIFLCYCVCLIVCYFFCRWILILVKTTMMIIMVKRLKEMEVQHHLQLGDKRTRSQRSSSRLSFLLCSFTESDTINSRSLSWRWKWGACDHFLYNLTGLSLSLYIFWTTYGYISDSFGRTMTKYQMHLLRTYE